MTASAPGFPDRLNWRHFVASGVVKNADGAFLAGWAYGGPDQDYAEFVSMESLANQLNAILAKLSGGWMGHWEAIRAPITITPAASHYPDLTSQLMGEERANEYATSGKHFETRLVFVLTWLPPLPMGRGLSRLLFGSRRRGKKHDDRVLLETFQRESQAVADALGHFLKVRRLTDDELKKFLWHCVTGEDKAVGTAPSGGMLNYALGAIEMEPPRQVVAGRHTRVVGVYGFPKGTTPQMLSDLLQLPMALRVSQRFIFLRDRKAIKELERRRNTEVYRNTYNVRRMAWNRANQKKEAGNDTAIVRRNTDADNQVDSIDQEITQLEAGTTRGGYYTLVVILRDNDEDVVDAQVAEIVQMLNRKGFQAKIEDDNFPAAFKGSLPGHSSNVRKPRLTVPHLVRLLVTSSPWRGYEQHPSPLYPKGSGPLLITKSSGSTPFCFTPQLHFLVIGPTGNGKTYLLNAMAMAHLQYERGQVFLFDRDAGGIVPTLACGGSFFDLDAQRYAPLAHIDQESEYAWALDFCEQLVKLRETTLTGEGRRALVQALKDLAKAPIAHRHMTGLLGQLQTSDRDLQAALSYYAGTGPGHVLDGQHSLTAESHTLTFDMEQLFKRAAAVHTPVLHAQIHALERRMTEGRPTLMMFDEGWSAASSEVLTNWIEEGSATMRKKVVRVGLVLHSPGDVSVFPHADRLLANIGTYVFLPNEMANTEGMRKHYADLGLGNREIKMIAEDIVPRRDYYVVEGQQRRVFQLSSGRWANALFGVNGRDHRNEVLKRKQKEGDLWLPGWLSEQGHHDLAVQWNKCNEGRAAA